MSIMVIPIPVIAGGWGAAFSAIGSTIVGTILPMVIVILVLSLFGWIVSRIRWFFGVRGDYSVDRVTSDMVIQDYRDYRSEGGKGQYFSPLAAAASRKGTAKGSTRNTESKDGLFWTG